MNGALAPIAFFAYRRPLHARNALRSLQRCLGADASSLFIFCDGARCDDDRAAVAAVRAVVREQRWCRRVEIVERERNLGLAASVVDGVSQLCARYGSAIVVEDDLLLAPHFLVFLNAALGRYRDVERVMHVSAYMFPVRRDLPETFFYRATSCWGWATWQRAWLHFESDSAALLRRLSGHLRRYQFDVRGSAGFFDMLCEQAAGRSDSWAIRWYASVFLRSGLCLHPARAFSKNVGHDGSGIHCCATADYEVDLAPTMVSRWPAQVREERAAVRGMAAFYRRVRRAPLTDRLRRRGRELLTRWSGGGHAAR
ncbi:MAG: hypothetical protein JXR83_21315 [Deltaproteobacteria bacterium]|nr:hypothetical protein [Deltaproteobacteria bacterium]